MGLLLTDPAFLATTFAVIDFESLTPTGRPPEPIEVAVIAGRFTRTGQWEETGRITSLMRPPNDVPVTPFDTGQTGLTAELLANERPAAQVMADLDRRFSRPPYRLVAHHAQTEATLIGGQRAHCPTLAATPLLCTVKLARVAVPELSTHKLDAVANYFGLKIPHDRHRAMPDVELTVQVLQRVLETGATAGKWANLFQVQAIGGVYVKPDKGGGDDAVQPELF
jgi:DNA polymerase III subunit epsilon